MLEFFRPTPITALEGFSAGSRQVALDATGQPRWSTEGAKLDFSACGPCMREAVVEFWKGDGRPTPRQCPRSRVAETACAKSSPATAHEIFENTVEEQLIHRIIHDYPVETSPLFEETKPG